MSEERRGAKSNEKGRRRKRICALNTRPRTHTHTHAS